jgi:hypothetical protein
VSSCASFSSSLMELLPHANRECVFSNRASF